MTIVRIRRGTTAQWASPTQGPLKAGEIGENTTTGEVKIGDGATAFASLPLINQAANPLIDVAAAPYSITPATSSPEVGIMSVVTYAAANGIPTVFVSKPGTYTVDLHTIPGQSFYAAALWGVSNVELIFAPGVVIKLKNGATLPAGASAAHIIGGDATTKFGWRVVGGVVDGNAANQSTTTILAGVALNRCEYSSVERVSCKSIYGTASAPPGETLHFEATKSINSYFAHCEANGSASANTATGFSTNHSFGIAWTDCVSHDMGHGMGFTAWMSSGLRYPGCHAYLNGASGFNAERSEDINYDGSISGGRSPYIEGTTENPYFPSGQTELGNGVGYSIQGCTDVVGDILSTYNDVNLSIYTNNPGGGLPARVNDRVVITGNCRHANTTEVHVETAATGGTDQVEVKVDVLSGGGTVPDTWYRFGKAPLIRYTTGASGVRINYEDTTGVYSLREGSSKVTGPYSGFCRGMTPDGQTFTSGILRRRRTTATSTAVTLLDDIIAVTDTTVTRTITLLPAADVVLDGDGYGVFTIEDESGAAATHPIVVACSGAETIDGAATIQIVDNYGRATVISTGTGYKLLDRSGVQTVDTHRAYELTTGESTLSRREITANFVASGNGNCRFACFQARKTETITQVRMPSAATAQVGATLCRIGIFSIDGSGNLTLIASTPNDTTLWVAANTAYTKALSASFQKVRGNWYAVGALVVGSSTAPTFLGQATITPAEAAIAPRLSGMANGLSDLPSSIAVGSIVEQAHQPYAVLLP